MAAKHPPAQYFEMAKHFRAIAEATLEPDTRQMVTQIAEDYERMGREAGGVIAEAAEAISDAVTGKKQKMA